MTGEDGVSQWVGGGSREQQGHRWPRDHQERSLWELHTESATGGWQKEGKGGQEASLAP